MDLQQVLKEYKIIRSSRQTLGMELKDDGLLIRAPRFASKREIERFINSNVSWIERQIAKRERQAEELGQVRILSEDEKRALAREAKRVIPERCAYYAEKVGVTYGTISIRWQKTRWGSCSAKGNLNFNCLLMLAPEEVLDSVIVHELCHRKQMNHSKLFYTEIYKVYPEYDKWNAWLKDNGKALMARAGK